MDNLSDKIHINSISDKIQKPLLDLIEEAIHTVTNYIDGYEQDKSKVDVALRVVLQYMREMKAAEKEDKNKEEKPAFDVEKVNRIKKMLDDLGM